MLRMQREPWTVENGGTCFGEWTYEGGRKRERVVTDGFRTRYLSGPHVCAENKWMHCINLGGTAGLSPVPYRRI